MNGIELRRTADSRWHQRTAKSREGDILADSHFREEPIGEIGVEGGWWSAGMGGFGGILWGLKWIFGWRGNCAEITEF